MNRLSCPFLLVSIGLGVTACQDERTPTEAVPEPPQPAIVHGATGGNPDFFFLPPTVPNPRGEPSFGDRPFNGALAPIVQICELAESNPALVDAATACRDPQPAGFPVMFTTSTGPGSETIRVEEDGEHYIVNWHTAAPRASAGRIFRIRVLVGSEELGFADAQLVRRGAALRGVDATRFVGVVAGRTLPLKFRIEQAALCDPPGSEPCSSETVSLAEESTVELVDPATGETTARVDIPAQPGVEQITTITMQLCEDLGQRGLVHLPTFGACIEITADPPLELDLVNPASVSICEFLPGGTTGLSEAQEDRVTMVQASGDGLTVTALPDVPSRCTENVGARSGNRLLRLARVGWQAVAARVATVLRPQPLVAAVVALDRGGAGGTTNFRSSFQYVLPGQLGFVDPADAERTAAPGDGLPVRVLVTDRGGDPVAGATVDFAVLEGGGALSASDAVTGMDGIAAVSWTLGAEPSTNRVEASGRGLAGQDDDGVFAPDHSLPPEDQPPVILGTGTLEFVARTNLLEIGGGTYTDRDAGTIRTAFLFNPVTPLGVIPFVTITGPAGWNDDAPFSCGFYQPPGTADDKSICWTGNIAPPVSGTFEASAVVGGEEDQTTFLARVVIDATSTLEPPEITAVTPQLDAVTIAWTASDDARSFLVRVNPVPFTGVSGELVVGAQTRTTTLTGLSLEPGAQHQAVVFAFSQDVSTPDGIQPEFHVGTDAVPFMAPIAPRVAGRIVVNNDEWTLSNTGFAQSADAGQFALNVASWFTGGEPGSFLVFSDNFGLSQGDLAATMTEAGHSWTVTMELDFTLENLQQFDGVFLTGDPADNQVLIDYVIGGGNVYLAGGTGEGGAAAEADRWNSFLNAFGLSFGSPYNSVIGVIGIESNHAIFTDVSGLYQDSGNPISDLTPDDPSSTILVSHQTGGLYAVFEQQPEPEP